MSIVGDVTMVRTSISWNITGMITGILQLLVGTNRDVENAMGKPVRKMSWWVTTTSMAMFTGGSVKNLGCSLEYGGEH